MFKEEHKEAEFWDRHGILDFASKMDEPISLDSKLKEEILSGKRREKLQNVSLRINPAFIQAIKKIAIQKSISYQSLVRMWLAENIKKELHIA